jgi:hypothetical protein
MPEIADATLPHCFLEKSSILEIAQASDVGAAMGADVRSGGDLLIAPFTAFFGGGTLMNTERSGVAG